MGKNSLLALTMQEANNKLISICLLLLRCTTGMILFTAGSGKVLGWFGGYGMHLTLQFYSKMGFSEPLAYLSSYTEFIGGFLIIVGLLTRPAAIAIVINMLVATAVTLPSGFLGPTGAQHPFVFLIMSIVILLAGPMTYSLDMLILKKYIRNS